MEKIENIRNHPITGDSKRLKGTFNIWRARVGDYRILYTVDYILKKVTIVKIDHRKNVYE